MNILFISPWFPEPQDNGAKLRFTNLLRGLRAGNEITLIAAIEPDLAAAADTVRARDHCDRLCVVPWQPGPPQGKARLSSHISADPSAVFFARSLALEDEIARELANRRYDLAVFFQLSTAVHALPINTVPIMLEEIELGGYWSNMHLRRTALARLRASLFWHKVKRSLPLLLRRFQGCTVASQTEYKLLRSISRLPRLVEIVPNCVDLGRYQEIDGHPSPDTLILPGSLTFPANYEGAAFFIQQVLPLIHNRRPDIRVLITGRPGVRPLPGGSAENVALLGLVPDVRPLIADSWVCIAPQLSGGGTRLKILEAMALGTPVVATVKAAEGLDVEAGRHLLVADSPEAFADAVVRLCSDQRLRQQLAAEARLLVRERYDWRSVFPGYRALLDRVASASTSL